MTMKSVAHYSANICPEALAFFTGRPLGKTVARALSRMTPARQIEAVHMMSAAESFTAQFARALVVTTPEDHLRDTPNNTLVTNTVPENIRDLMASELRALSGEIDQIRDRIAPDLYSLLVVDAYVRKLLRNERVLAFLSKHHPETLERLKQVSGQIAADVDAAPDQKQAVRRRFRL